MVKTEEDCGADNLEIAPYGCCQNNATYPAHGLDDLGTCLVYPTFKIDSFCITDLIAVSKISEKNSSFLVQFTILFVMLRLTQALHFQAIFAVFKDFVSAFNWDIS